MMEKNHENKVFEKVNFANKELKNATFEKCTFTNCDFANSNLSSNTFNECCFDGCNMGMAKLNKTKLTHIRFVNCKLIGINFYECTDFLFSANFDNCLLDYTSFAGKKMPKVKFINSSLKEANFSNSDLSESIFENCNLEGTIFNKSILNKADLTTAFNFSIDPEFNKIKKTKFSRSTIHGLLSKYDIVIE